jgi:dTDP-D-glucose 4,6-dehydratase
MKILNTGGVGFIGSAIIRHIIDNTIHSVVNVDKLSCAGNLESMIEAPQFVRTIEKRQGMKIACLEEIAWRNHWIYDNQLYNLISALKDTENGVYLLRLLKEKNSV